MEITQVSYLFPNKCIVCSELSEDGKAICRNCYKKLPVTSGRICERCGREELYCNCKIGDFAFVRNISLYRYEDSAKKLLLNFKYHNKPQLAVYMGHKMSKLISVMYKDIKFDYITYVPMTHLKLFSRGYNQAKLLAEQISKDIRVPIAPLLIKKLSLRSQKYTRGKNRRDNVKNKFKSIQILNSKTVLLIDDVMTSGSTLSECAYALKKANADKVYCATFAITCKK